MYTCPHTQAHIHTQPRVPESIAAPQLTLGELIHLLSKAIWCVLLIRKMLSETEPTTFPQKIP